MNLIQLVIKKTLKGILSLAALKGGDSNLVNQALPFWQLDGRESLVTIDTAPCSHSQNPAFQSDYSIPLPCPHAILLKTAIVSSI